MPVVWIMSESRAVANEHEGHKRIYTDNFQQFLNDCRPQGVKQGTISSLVQQHDSKFVQRFMKKIIKLSFTFYYIKYIFN